MKSKQTPGQRRKWANLRSGSHLRVSRTARIRRLTERELEQFRTGVQAAIDRVGG